MLITFEVGLFGWMTLTSFPLFPHPRTYPAYWLMMQIGMILGFLTSDPVNIWLIKRGIEEAM